MPTKTSSPARDLVQVVWDNAPRDSWQRLNAAMYSAVKLAVRAGLTFAKDDFDHFESSMRMYYWIGQGGVESLYGTAVGQGNTSACQAIEAFLNREPFLFEGVRIHVGHDFVWQGEMVRCTSIDQDSLIACSYRAPGKVHRRHTITREEVRACARASRAEKKAAKEAKEQLVREEKEKRRAEEEKWRAENEEHRRRFEEQQRHYRQERIASLQALAPEVLTRTVTIEDAVAAKLCREGVVDFCARFLDGRQTATLHEVIEAAAAAEADGGIAHYLDSIGVLAAYVGRTVDPAPGSAHG